MHQTTLNKLVNFIRFLMAKYRGFTGYSLLMVCLLVLFESAQQYYYILQFDLVPLADLSFSTLILGQSYRWLIWLVVAMTYFGIIIFKGKSDRLFQSSNIAPAALHLFLLIAANVFIISLLQMTLSGRALNLLNLWDNLIFYTFQKAPIYTLAYGAMLGLFHFIDSNQNLEVQILSLQKQHQLPQTKDLEALSIKIGNKNKIISFENILWIEAYDYCVKIHTVDEHSYAMRKSLKALEKKLLNHQFLRVHRRAIVNMKKVKEVTYNASSYLTLNDQSRIDIAQSRVRDLKDFFQPAS